MKKKNFTQKSEFELSPYEQELILAHILKKSREYVLAHPDIKLTKGQSKKYTELTVRRRKKEPLAYILGQKGFYGLDFKVTRHTLIPRPETEHLTDAVISNLKLVTGGKKSAVIDVGTGSGNIIISLAKEIINSKLPIANCQLLATDISHQALKVAKFNARKHKADRKIKFIKSNLLDYFIKHGLSNIEYLIITANLPYLSKKIYASSMPDVKNFEPISALLSGTDGLDHYRKLFKQLRQLIKNCSALRIMCCIEFSPEQKTELSKLAKHSFPKSNHKFQKDLSGKWRVLAIKI